MLVLQVQDLIVITDYFVIASGATERQVRTITEEVERVLRERGVKPIRREGVEQGRWVLIDFGDVVLHAFTTEEREYYELERLWKYAPRVRWEQPAKKGTERTRKGGDSAG